MTGARRFIFALCVVCLSHTLTAQQAGWQIELNKITGKQARITWLIDCVKENKRFIDQQPDMLDAAMLLADQIRTDSVYGKVHNAIGNYYEKNGDLPGAWNEYRQARFYFLKSRLYDESTGASLRQCYLLLQQGMPDSMLVFLDHNRALFSLSSDKMKLNVKHTHAMAIGAKGNAEQAVREYKSLLPLSEAVKDTGMLIALCLNIGNDIDDLDSAIYYTRKALPLVTGNHRKRYAEVMFKLGYVYAGLNDESGDSALHYLLLAEKEIDMLGNVIWKAQVENMISSFFITRNEYALALPYLRKAYGFSGSIESMQTNMIAHNLFICFHNLRQKDSAAFYLDVFRKKIARSGSDYELELYHHARAKQLAAEGDSCAVAVIASLNKALAYAEKAEDTRLAISIITDAIECMLENNPEHIKPLTTEMLARCSFFHPLIKNESNLYLYSEFLSAYARLEGVYGDRRKALELYDELTRAYKALDAERYQKGREESLIKYKSEIKDKEIAYAKKQNLFLTAGTALLLCIAAVIFAALWKIRKQRSALRQLNQLKDRLFSVISHDLRTPISTLLSFSRLLERGDVPAEKLAVYTGELKQSLGYTSDLMGNLLGWARTQMQGYKPVMEAVAPAQVAAKEIEFLEGAAKQKGITIINDIDRGVKVIADINMLGILYRNLVGNAIKYSVEGSSVLLDSQQEDASVQLSVKDTGTGMNAKQVAAFNAHTNSEPAESTPGTNNESGTGLGLMLCKNFVALMKGKMMLESEAGKGSCFTVELKRA